MSTSTKWRIVVEPNELIRYGLIDLVRESGHANYAAFETIEEMETLVDPDATDVMLIVNLGDDEVLVARSIKRLKSRRSTSQLVLLSNKYSHSHLHTAINAGASGYILTSVGCEALSKSLQVIALGQAVIPEEALKLISNALNKALPSKDQFSRLPAGLLSDREFVVLRCLRTAMSNKVIAHECNLAEPTVRAHVRAILRKINAKNRTEAAIWALEHGVEPFPRQTQPDRNQLESASDKDISATRDKSGPVTWTLRKDRAKSRLN